MSTPPNNNNNPFRFSSPVGTEPAGLEYIQEEKQRNSMKSKRSGGVRRSASLNDTHDHERASRASLKSKRGEDLLNQSRSSEKMRKRRSVSRTSRLKEKFNALWKNVGTDRGGKKKKEGKDEEEIKQTKTKIDLRNKELAKTKEEIQRKYEHYYNKWRDYDLLTSILSILGLVVAILDVIIS